MSLAPLPPLSTSGIGSLPYTQTELALQHAFLVDVPYLPSLPQMNAAELMVPQALEGLPGLVHDGEGGCTVDLAAWERGRRDFAGRLERALSGRERSWFEPSPLASRAWRPFLWDVEARHVRMAKVQLTGPFTLRAVVTTTDGAPLSAHPELESQVQTLVLVRAMAMAAAIRDAGATPLVFLDEPGLYALDRRQPRHLLALQELRMLVLALRKEGAHVGLHCCSNTDWERVLGIEPDVLSLDARLSLGSLCAHPNTLRRHLDAGHGLALGVVPTNQGTVISVEQLHGELEQTLSLHLEDETLRSSVRRAALLTPACGLALRSVPDAERTFAALGELQLRLRGAFS